MISFSLGIYTSYWYYRHWMLYRGQQGFKWVPLLCAIAAPIMIYPLMKRIVRKNLDMGHVLDCSALSVTLMFWLPCLLLVAGVVSFTDTPETSLALSLMILLPLLSICCTSLPLVAMIQLQQTANRCEGDELGQSNARITWANGLWIIFSWLPFLALLGFVLTLLP